MQLGIMIIRSVKECRLCRKNIRHNFWSSQRSVYRFLSVPIYQKGMSKVGIVGSEPKERRYLAIRRIIKLLSKRSAVSILRYNVMFCLHIVRSG